MTTDNDDDINEFEDKSEPVPIEKMSNLNRVRIAPPYIKASLYRDLVDICKAEDMTIQTLTRRALTRFAREYKEKGVF